MRIHVAGLPIFTSNNSHS